MTAYIIDTETTGNTPAEPIELAYGAYVDNRLTLPLICERFKPAKPSSLGALSVHHILDAELEGLPPASAAKLPGDATYIIGHNVDYDWEVLGKPPVKRICTLALARHFYPKADSHKLGAMLYLLGGDQRLVRHALRNAHAASADVEFCATILEAMLEKNESPEISIENLWNLSEKARIPTVMTFGKHKGLPIALVDKGYRAWYMRQPDPDPYLVAAFKATGA